MRGKNLGLLSLTELGARTVHLLSSGHQQIAIPMSEIGRSLVYLSPRPTFSSNTLRIHAKRAPERQIARVSVNGVSGKVELHLRLRGGLYYYLV